MDQDVVYHPRYDDMISALDASGGWRALAEIGDDYGEVLSVADLALAERRPSPSRFLLDRLSERFHQPLTAAETVDLLEALGGPAAAAAELLLPPRPPTVRPLTETNSARVWVPLGGRLLLHCEAAARPAPAFCWRRGDAPVPGGDAAELCVQPFSASDAGWYSCEVRGAGGVVVSAGSVCVEPKQTPPQETGRWPACATVTVRGDNPLELRVQWTGWPLPRLRWERDGELLAGCETDTLTLSPGPTLSDGKYVCVAANDVGEVSSQPFVVEMDQRPVILSHPQAGQRRHAIGRPLTLRCSAFCRRPLKVTWRRSMGEQGDLEKVMPPHDVSTERSADGVTHTELRLTPTEDQARRECVVTCEFLADGDFDSSYSRSRPARFRVVYAAHSKMALIIGNADYKNLTSLHEVNRDVAEFREAMHELGFGTLLAMNLSLQRSLRTVEYFARVAAPDAYLVVLVAGHGFTYQRQDYLVPVDHPPLVNGALADLASCLSITEHLEHRLQETSFGVLVLCGDICRTKNEVPPNAVGLTAGGRLAGPSRFSPNVVRLFSTQMGQEALDDGRFIRHLLRTIRQDISVPDMTVLALREISSPEAVTSAQMAQYAIMETSMTQQRSLLDIVDCTTALDTTVTRKYSVRLDQSRSATLEETWSNYVWDAEPELLLTFRLSDAPRGFYIKLIIDSKKPQPLRFKLESGHFSSPVSSWRVMAVPANSECLSLDSLCMLFGSTEAGAGRGAVAAVPLPPVQLQLGPLGLVAAHPPANQPDEGKVSNVPHDRP